MRELSSCVSQHKNDKWITKCAIKSGYKVAIQILIRNPNVLTVHDTKIWTTRKVPQIQFILSPSLILASSPTSINYLTQANADRNKVLVWPLISVLSLHVKWELKIILRHSKVRLGDKISEQNSSVSEWLIRNEKRNQLIKINWFLNLDD